MRRHLEAGVVGHDAAHNLSNNPGGDLTMVAVIVEVKEFIFLGSGMNNPSFCVEDETQKFHFGAGSDGLGVVDKEAH